MDVVDARPDLIGIIEVLEGVQQLHVGTRGLDGDDIGIHGGDSADDVVELRIAHMGVDLRLVGHHGSAQLEALHRPVEICLPLGLAQRQSFP